jgi:hypothetical protein
MAIISMRSAGDLPLTSDYMPLISWYFFLSLLFTFASFMWFSACNFYRTTGSLPMILNRMAKLLLKTKQFIFKCFKVNKVENLAEIETMISALNYFALFIMTLPMFGSYLTIWLIISN